MDALTQNERNSLVKRVGELREQRDAARSGSEGLWTRMAVLADEWEADPMLRHSARYVTDLRRALLKAKP